MPRIRLAVLIFTACLVTGCGGDNAASEGSRDGTYEPSVDLSSPIEVAEAFYAAVDEGDLEGAVMWVVPGQQEDFRSAMEAGMPDLPGDYEVVVMAQGAQAEASIAGMEMEVEMELIDGRWWVGR